MESTSKPLNLVPFLQTLLLFKARSSKFNKTPSNIFWKVCFSGEQILEAGVNPSHLCFDLFFVHPSSPIQAHYHLITDSCSIIHDRLNAFTPSLLTNTKNTILNTKYQIWHPKYTLTDTKNTISNTPCVKYRVHQPKYQNINISNKWKTKFDEK